LVFEPKSGRKRYNSIYCTTGADYNELIQSIYDENYVVRLEAERLALVTISIANTADRPPQAARFADLKKRYFQLGSAA
jgi:hypothetical protein